MYLKAIGNNQMTIEMVKGSRSGQLQSFNPFNNNNVATFSIVNLCLALKMVLIL